MSTARDFIAMLDRAAPRLEEDPANECCLCNSVPAGWCVPLSVPAARGPRVAVALADRAQLVEERPA